MDPSRGGDSRYNLNYGMSGIGLSLADQADLYGNPAGGLGTGGGGGGRPPSGGLIQTMGRSPGLMSHAGGGGGGGTGAGGGGGGTQTGNNGGGGAGQCQSMGGQSRGIKRSSSDCYDDHHRGGSGGSMTSQTLQGLESCGPGNGSGGSGQQTSGNVPDVVDDSYSLQNKKSPPANGKKTKGRVKIKMEYIDNKLRRYTTFSKRKTGIMKKAYELSTLTGTQVMLLVASETGHVYTFATRKLQPMITSEAGKQLIQTCLNSPDPPTGGGGSAGGGDQRMSATGFEETELSYNIADEDSKDDRSPITSGNESDDSSDMDSPRPSSIPNSNQSVIISQASQQQQHQHHHHHQQQQQQQLPSASSSTADSPPLLVDSRHSHHHHHQHHQQQQQQQQHSHNQKQQSNLIHHVTTSSSGNVGGGSSASQSITTGGGGSGGGSASTTVHYDVMKLSPLTQLSGTNNVVYPATALGSLPQEVLLGLVQSGHFQLHSEEDSGGSNSSHQFITIPISMATTNAGGGGAGSSSISNSSSSTVASSGDIDMSSSSHHHHHHHPHPHQPHHHHQVNVTRGSSSSTSTTNVTTVSSGNGSKIRVKDLSTNRQTTKATSRSLNNTINGGNSDGKNISLSSKHDDSSAIHIKTEIID